MFLCICFYAFVNTPQRFIWKLHFTCSSYILFLNFLKNYFVFKNIISFQNVFMCISLVFLSFFSCRWQPLHMGVPKGGCAFIFIGIKITIYFSICVCCLWISYNKLCYFYKNILSVFITSIWIFSPQIYEVFIEFHYYGITYII